MKQTLYIFLIMLFNSACLSVFSQVDRGGIPRSLQESFLNKSPLDIEEVTAPDLLALQKEDLEDSRLEKPYRVGVTVPVHFTLQNSGHTYRLIGGGQVWRLQIKCAGAQGIGLNFNSLRLPTGADLFVYTPDHKVIIGAITENEIPSKNGFATRPIPGEELIVEYFEPDERLENPQFEISEITYMYRSFGSLKKNNPTASSSDNCEVDINCHEGDNWQNQKKCVVKILTKVGSKNFYCTGSLLNNTSVDYSGLLLTAGHCAKDNGSNPASASDLTKWIFYFNYEAQVCGEPPISLIEQTIVGAEKLAMADADTGSDFLLLKSLIEIPPKYYSFYCGWDAVNETSLSGVGIHHPNGDVKKVSTYKTELTSGSWDQTPNTHWIVKWAETVSGFGVTEGGSSGSPLFDEEGLIVGTLTGGESSCQNTVGEDLYGKVSYSWASNGSLPAEQLKPWLDPESKGLIKIPGTFNEKYAAAEFSANTRVIPVGNTVDFFDLSTGKPNTWHWYFQAGEPPESTEQNPKNIRFTRFGLCNVKLIVSNQYNSDTVVKEEYIDVKAIVSPNPSAGTVNILADIGNPHALVIEVFNSFGKIAQHFEYPGPVSSSYPIVLPEYGNFFIIKIKQGDQIQSHKVIVVR